MSRLEVMLGLSLFVAITSVHICKARSLSKTVASDSVSVQFGVFTSVELGSAAPTGSF